MPGCGSWSLGLTSLSARLSHNQVASPVVVVAGVCGTGCMTALRAGVIMELTSHACGTILIMVHPQRGSWFIELCPCRKGRREGGRCMIRGNL